MIIGKKDDYSMHFGGIIYLSDFETGYCNGNIAQRIMSDWKFDKQCKRNTELRDQPPMDETTEGGND